MLHIYDSEHYRRCKPTAEYPPLLKLSSSCLPDLAPEVGLIVSTVRNISFILTSEKYFLFGNLMFSFLFFFLPFLEHDKIFVIFFSKLLFSPTFYLSPVAMYLPDRGAALLSWRKITC